MSITLSLTETTFELLVGAFVAVTWAALAGVQAACGLLWCYRWAVAVAAFWVVSAAFPVLPVGIAIIAVFGLATYPRTGVN